MSYSLPTTQFRHYINGELVQGDGRVTTILCPGNEEEVANVALATKEQAEQALQAAQAAFPVWSAMSLEERGTWILKLRDAIAAEADNLLTLLILETGKVRAHAAFETGSLTGYLSFFLEQAKCEHSEGIRDMTGGKSMFLAVREPVGVVVAALAWNFPMHNLATKLGPILASGCTAVIKPATKTPLSTMYLGEIMQRIHFPKGVINFVAGDAKEIGTTLCESPIPAMITMIGSTVGGLKMVRDSTTSVKRFSMELGGNAPAIVTEHADLKAAAAHIVGNKMRCAGQTCVAPQRALVQRGVYEQFLALCKEIGDTAKCGTLDEDANTGALIDGAAVTRMEALVADAVGKGAGILCGGKRPDYKEKGFYFLPTILTGVTREMRVFREEIFGPILCVLPYDSEEEAIAMANDTEYGLSSYIWSTDLNQVNHLSKGIRYGIVNVNGPGTGPSVPHGGCKNSGIGKDGSRYSLEEYTYIKGMRIALN